MTSTRSRRIEPEVQVPMVATEAPVRSPHPSGWLKGEVGWMAPRSRHLAVVSLNVTGVLRAGCGMVRPGALALGSDQFVQLVTLFRSPAEPIDRQPISCAANPCPTTLIGLVAMRSRFRTLQPSRES